MNTQGQLHTGSAGEGAKAPEARQTYRPVTDVIETGDALEFFVEVPGAMPESVSVEFEKGTLSIRARATCEAHEGTSTLRRETEPGDYARVFEVGEGFDIDHISAVLTDGVLKLTLPKMKPAPAKKIKVTPAQH